MAEVVSFAGVVEAVYFENPSNLYKVMRVAVQQDVDAQLSEDTVVCTGQFSSIHLDTEYEFFGQLTQHPKYGEQFAVVRYQQLAPTSEAGVIDFLSSHRFSGIGKTLAQRIVESLGVDAIDKIMDDQNVLKQIKGLTPEKRTLLYETLRQHRGTERIFLKLTEWGFGPRLADKIFAALGDETVELIETNPYILVEKVEGIGFFKADILAEQLGIEADSQARMVAGLITAVAEVSTRNGDTYVERPQLLQYARQLLERSRAYLIEDELLEQALDAAIMNKQLMLLDQGVMLPSLYYAETGIVTKLSDFMRYEQVENMSEAEIEAKLDEVSAITGITYDAQQRKAMVLAMRSPLSVITGGPGTGKTTLISGILVLHRLLYDYPESDVTNRYSTGPVLLAAPTGRAAKRMQEMTGITASTIHRLIGYNRESSFEAFNPATLEGQLLIVDEMSMVDTWLMNWLWRAIPYNMQVILVGDKHQLPSVGPGKVFADLIDSGVAPTISLNKIYRQAQDSAIIQLAHHIRQGALPNNLLAPQSDRSFIRCHTNQVAHVIQQVVKKAQERGYNETNLQVLAPMYKGPAGIIALNTLLQNLLNPAKAGKPELQHFNQTFRLGDKVLQLVNNADEGVYNGDIGKITGIYGKELSESGAEELIVEFDDQKELVYRRSDLDQLTLAYCCSVHKAQGSEYPLVILPMVEAYHRMLRKDLLYTAVTRAKQSLVLIGDPACYHKAVTQDEVKRRTNLADLLQVKLKSDKVAKLATEEVIVQAKASITAQLRKPINTEAPESSVQLDVPNEVAEEKEEPIEWRLIAQQLDAIDPMIGMAGVTPYDFMEQT